MHITIYLTSGSIQVGPWSDFPVTSIAQSREHGALPLSRRFDEFQARAFLNQHFRDSTEICRLRAALACDTYNLTRMHDADVVWEAARRLTEGTWIVTDRQSDSLAAVPTERTAGQRASTRPATSASAGTQKTVTARPLTPRTVRKAPAPEYLDQVPQEEPDWSDSTEDQIAQAIALENAATLAIPFCEVCEAARKARVEAAA